MVNEEPSMIGASGETSIQGQDSFLIEYYRAVGPRKEARG